MAQLTATGILSHLLLGRPLACWPHQQPAERHPVLFLSRIIGHFGYSLVDLALQVLANAHRLIFVHHRRLPLTVPPETVSPETSSQTWAQ